MRAGSPEALGAFIEAHHEGGFYVELARDQLNRMKPPTSPKPTPTAAPSPPVQVAKASPSDADPCKTEGARLQALRSNPSPEAVTAFASEMTCGSLRPQLARLMESAGISAPATLAAPLPAMTRLASRTPDPGGCPGEVHELEALRADPDVAQAKALDRRLTCAALRPQLERLLESMGETVTGSGRAIEVAPSPPEDPAACAAETVELAGLRAHPDLNATRAFSAALRCKALAPQTARLLESLSD